ncbi:MAG: hypothetical protein A2622_05950 [Bdellovibrionales bacterium RIFCSPHIGHO2_01_FULL_40_29]|nr:MAG: hypothetical protein A2622_05950 [Bdellovibrionales bacterium RIFCSPHIGHO2_01_FULL_40_29]OFZ34996.1 MAG: hypothetical protein A3D17_06300 [Bdellovibrionales bacterium RIFCSPHIGHO2_02_FULL_40_15]
MPKIDHHRIDEIEVLRAVAILFTLIHHTAFYLFLQPNLLVEHVYGTFTFWGGVDLFFVISGFVIMKSLNHSMQTHVSRVGAWRVMIAFWIRRIWRILPSAWLWLGLFLMASYYLNTTGALGIFKNNLTDANAAFLQYANYHGYLCANRVMTCGPNGVYWSLSLEEQFYILFPLSILIFRKFFPLVLIIALIPQLLIERFEWSLGWAFRFDTLIWGVLLALWTTHSSYKKYEPHFLTRYFWLKWILIPTAIFGMAFIPEYKNRIPLATTLLGFICLLLVFLASYDRGYLMKDSILRKILLWFGSRSYSLYLIHILCFRISYELLYQFSPVGYRISTADSTTVFIISYIMLFILSELNYRFLEIPLRNYGSKKAKHFLEKSTFTNKFV